MKTKFLKYLLLFVINILTCMTYSQDPKDRPTPLIVTKTRIYKTMGLTKLKLYIFQPSGCKEGDRLPTVVFFHGGGWAGGNSSQFIPQCKYLANHGMVAISAEYRVRKRQGVMPFECVADAKSAIRWVRANAYQFGIDKNQIAAGGGSAGGHIAACAALIKDFDDNKEDLNISSVPNALVIFNAPLDVPEIVHILPKKVIKALHNREKEISPIDNVSNGAPPTIIFHGTADNNVPFHQSTRFCEEMKKHANQCEVVPFEGLGHGFFNYYNGINPSFYSTMESTVKFFKSIGYLKEELIIK
jgi:acetyl esterase